VSTPQDVALSDVRKGIAMFQKISVPITGLILNESYFICPTCTTPHRVFGVPDMFHATAKKLALDVLAELPLVPDVSTSADKGWPFMLHQQENALPDKGNVQWLKEMTRAAHVIQERILPSEGSNGAT